ncbi:unnamed protein product [Acanthoscelides obtectus]|uniref:RNA-directed DNA polymerase n=1 Tax=Acanthoscelides obtectus TaxID=200917 RepID=A0A9P0MB01_ACAOB|nr:unnamed protein product [Acanthoscelides obtectus]CAK1632892.1 Retrovirus-related Pol polyprotein from transposon 412 [Acanthoscelides obtectus]
MRESRVAGQPLWDQAAAPTAAPAHWKDCRQSRIRAASTGLLRLEVYSPVTAMPADVRSNALAFGASLKDLKEICEIIKIPEVIMLKNSKNKLFIEHILRDPNEMKDMNPKISKIRDVQKVENKEIRHIILNDFHILPTGGHAGMNRMYNIIKKFYFWNGLQRAVQDFVSKCDECQRYEHSRPYVEPMSITTTASSAFQKCELTKFVECYPIKNKEATTVAGAFVENFILRFRIPQEIGSDKGTEFISTTLREICNILEVKQICSTAYHHQSLDRWRSWVQFWSFAFNTTVHTGTKYTPYELVFGKVCNLPSNIKRQVGLLYNLDSQPLELKFRLQQAQADAKNNLLISKNKRKKTYDLKINTISYKPVDILLIKNEGGTKMEAFSNGPYRYVVIEDKAPNI